MLLLLFAEALRRLQGLLALPSGQQRLIKGELLIKVLQISEAARLSLSARLVWRQVESIQKAGEWLRLL